MLRTSTPLLTLDRNIPNWITAVDLTVIRRRSKMARGAEEDSAVAAREVHAIWTELQEHGHTTFEHIRRSPVQPKGAGYFKLRFG